MGIRTLYLFFLIITFSFYHPCYAMEKESDISQKVRPLNWIEREIFISSIDKDGIDLTQKKLDTMKVIQDFYITIDLDLYPNHRNSVLHKMIYEAIKLREKKEPYRSKDEEVTKQDTVCLIYKKNNFLGDYTKYWHRKDLYGNDYIKCLTIFENREVLEDVFEPLEVIFRKKAAEALLLIEQLFSPKLIGTHSSQTDPQ
jgi:hypothetical protein